MGACSRKHNSADSYVKHALKQATTPPGMSTTSHRMELVQPPSGHAGRTEEFFDSCSATKI